MGRERFRTGRGVRRRQRFSGTGANSGEGEPTRSDEDERVARIRRREFLEGFTEMRKRLERWSPSARFPLPSVPSEIARDPVSHRLWEELTALAKAITSAKREIAMLRRRDNAAVHAAGTTDELDAIAEASLSAVETILSSAEQIDDAVCRLRSQTRDASQLVAIDAAAEAVVRIFEACSFQDIAAQRMLSVIAIVKDIEERVQTMISTMEATAAPTRGDSAEGPACEDNPASARPPKRER